MSLSNGTKITWLGHATVLVQLPNGTNLLIDPFIEHNPKYPKGFVLPEKIDYVLLTHAHFDHTADAIPVATKHGSTIIAIVELAGYMAGKGAASTIGINLGGTVQLPGVDVTMVDAKHSSSIDEGGVSLYLGEAAGFILTIAGGPVLYHAGDTSVFGDMSLIHDIYAPTIALLPIGDFYTMGPKEAAVATRLLQPRIVLPIHWGTFPPLKGTPQELAQILKQPELVESWEPGQTFQK
ncbi:metal-dependent hydrolase [Acidicapsa ligni]|uniref:metal-dependent hydrolase n=1 Tax=Acidicapsa ligni TaxID=542300 RepID=UPI0021E0ADEC|nr:metal-dependent hydrolase [Acidicapsa ligni]